MNQAFGTHMSTALIDSRRIMLSPPFETTFGTVRKTKDFKNNACQWRLINYVLRGFKNHFPFRISHVVL